MDANKIKQYPEVEALQHVFQVPQELWKKDHPTVALGKAIFQYNLWKEYLPEAYKHYFHDTNELIPSSSFLAQKVNAFYRYWTVQPKFKLPFDPSCWSYIYNATKEQLGKDASLPPLHFAIKYKKLDMIKALLKEKGVDSIFQLNDENASVEFAATKGDPDFYVELFKMGCSKIDLMTDYLITNSVLDKPLRDAAKKGYVRVIPALIKAGAHVNAQNWHRTTAIHFAASNGDVKLIRMLAKLGADINAKDFFGKTPLHETARDEKVEAFHTLAKLGAGINAKDKYGRTPLHMAASRGSIDTIRTLIKHGADIDAKDNVGDTPLHLAALCGQIEAIRTLVKLGADIHAKDHLERTPLHEAAMKGKIEAIRTLVELKADINAKDRLERTPVLAGYSHCGGKSIPMLVKLGADINAKSNDGYTLLHKAARNGKIETIRMLVKLGADINATDKSGKTPLHMTANWYRIEACNALVLKGADLYAPLPNGQTVIEAYPDLDFSQAVENYNLFNSTRLSHSVRAARCEALFIHSNSPKPSNPNCWSTEAQLREDVNLPPLHSAIKHQNLDMVKALLKEEGVDSIFQLTDANATVDFAATEGDPDFYVELIKMGYSKLALMPDYLITNSVFDKLLLQATEKGYVRVIPALISAGANMQAQDSNGNTALHCAAKSGNSDIVKLLVDKGADVNAKGGDLGRTPLHYAALYGNVKVIRMLIQLDANPNAKDKYGNTPLHDAASHGKVESIHTLVQLGGDINFKNQNGFTPLHAAAKYGKAEAVRLLLSHGADINSKNKNGFTPFLVAAKHGKIDIINTFASLGVDLYAPLPDGRTVVEAFPQLNFSQAIENYNMFNSTRLSHMPFAAHCEALFEHSNSPEPYQPDN